MDDASPTVFVIDDDTDMRESLAFLLQSVGIATRVFSTATAFLTEYRSDQPGCLVCDVRMPDMSGLELYERLITAGLRIPVIFMTAYADVPMAVRALKSGAVEFVEKPFNAQTMLERIQRALAEDRQRREDAAHWQDVGTRMESLTDKEREVLAMILAGAPNKAIAAKTEITERAVEMRRASVMRKLQVHSLAELIRLVTQFEMITDPRANRRWM
jgi:FixJ family two-component response regulator